MANYRLRIGYAVGYSLSCDSGTYSLNGQLVGLAYNSSSQNLTWGSVPGATGYRVYYGTAPGNYIQAPGSGVDVGNVLSYAISLLGLTADVTYFFVIVAYDNGGPGGAKSDGAPSAEIQVLNGVIVG